jgi:hypothetical protein
MVKILILVLMCGKNIQPLCLCYSHLQDYKIIGDRFDIAVINPPSRQIADSIRKYNSSLPIFGYRNLIAMHTRYEDWDKCNLKEFAFLHGTDPAGISVIPSNETCIINWQNDCRNVVTGYNLYTSPYASGGYKKVNNRVITNTNYVDNEFKSPQYYLIKSVIHNHNEIDFSTIKFAEAKKKSIILTKPYYKVTDTDTSNDSIRIEIYLSVEKFGDIEPDSAIAHLCLNRSWFNFIDYPFTMSTTDNKTYSCTTELVIPVSYKAGIPYYFTFIKDTTLFRLPQDDSTYYTTNMNNRLRNPNYGWYGMDAASSDWISHYISQCRTILATGADGIFADDATREILWRLDCPPVGFNRENWINSIASMISSVKKAIEPKKLIFNGLKNDHKFLKYADGGMIEGFAHTYSGYVKKKKWENQIDAMLKSHLNKKILVISRGEEEDRAARIFSLASFLLGYSKTSYYCYAERYGRVKFYPEYEIDMGDPIEYPRSVRHLCDKKTGVYSRKFKNGIIIVNPDTLYAEIPTIKKTLYMSVLKKETKSGNDIIEYIPIQGKMSILPQTGLILLFKQ